MSSGLEKQCMNCGQPLKGHFCYQCGQSANTHRFSVLGFLTHDVVHGIWHVDKGILFTIKEILLRPGYAARDYISGKRKAYFNLLSLAVLVIALTLLVSDKLETSSELVVTTNSGKRVDDLFVNNIKILLFSFLPIFACCNLLFFRRLRYNYAEHLVAATFFFNGFMLLILLQKLLGLFIDYNYLEWYWANIAVEVAYLVFACYQLARSCYTIAGTAWRAVASIFLFSCFSLFLFICLFLALDLQEFTFEFK